MAKAGKALTFCVLGGEDGTGNLGVSALGLAAIKHLGQAFPEAKFIMRSWAPQDTPIVVQSGSQAFEVEPLKLYSSDDLLIRHGARHLAALHGITRHLPAPLRRGLTAWNGAFEKLSRADVVFDAAGGDAFADTYGERVFACEAGIKRLVLALDKPLVLLPQTLGPFRTPACQAIAREVIGQSLLVATRDLHGLTEAAALFGGRLPEHVVACPDMAFGLDPMPVPLEGEPLLARRAAGEPLIGINVSGMLYYQGQDFGLRDCYPGLIEGLVRWAVERHGARVVLIPHVVSHAPPEEAGAVPSSGREPSDTLAAKAVLAQVGERYPDQVSSLRWGYSAGQTKYLIGQCDFVIGGRMHACIAAASQGIATVTLAYSKKALGVMSHLQMDAAVVDLRTQTNPEILETVDELYRKREDLHQHLVRQLPAVRAQLGAFFSQRLRKALAGAGLEVTAQ